MLSSRLVWQTLMVVWQTLANLLNPTRTTNSQKSETCQWWCTARDNLSCYDVCAQVKLSANKHLSGLVTSCSIIQNHTLSARTYLHKSETCRRWCTARDVLMRYDVCAQVKPSANMHLSGLVTSCRIIEHKQPSQTANLRCFLATTVLWKMTREPRCFFSDICALKNDSRTAVNFSDNSCLKNDSRTEVFFSDTSVRPAAKV